MDAVPRCRRVPLVCSLGQSRSPQTSRPQSRCCLSRALRAAAWPGPRLPGAKANDGASQRGRGAALTPPPRSLLGPCQTVLPAQRSPGHLPAPGARLPRGLSQPSWGSCGQRRRSNACCPPSRGGPTRLCKIPFSQARGSLCAAAGRTAGRLISGPRNWSMLRDVTRGSLSLLEEAWP